MPNEFQAPNRENEQNVRYQRRRNMQSKLGPFDQIMATVLGFILISLLGWIGYTSYQNSMGIIEVKTEIKNLQNNRDLGILVLEKRVDKVEIYLDQLKEKNVGREKN